MDGVRSSTPRGWMHRVRHLANSGMRMTSVPCAVAPPRVEVDLNRLRDMEELLD